MSLVSQTLENQVINEAGAEDLKDSEALKESKLGAEVTTKYSGRKSFAFSDKAMYESVEELLTQKPEGLTNAEFLHEALKHYVESDELNQTFHHLPVQAVDIFKGDLEKLNIAFEMIRETFKTQMVASTQLIGQREEKLTRQFDRERDLLEQRIESLTTEVSLLTEQKRTLSAEAEQTQALKQELNQLKPTVGTLQQALEASHQQVELMKKELAQVNAEELNQLKKEHSELKELFTTNNIRLQHAQEQEKRALNELEQARKEIDLLKQSAETTEQQQKEELKAVREELATAHQTIQELYQKLLKA